MTAITNSEQLIDAINIGGEPEHEAHTPVPKPSAMFIIRNVGNKKLCTSGQSGQPIQDRPIYAKDAINNVNGRADPSQKWTFVMQRDNKYTIRNVKSRKYAWVTDEDGQNVTGMKVVENGVRVWRLTWEGDYIRITPSGGVETSWFMNWSFPSDTTDTSLELGNKTDNSLWELIQVK